MKRIATIVALALFLFPSVIFAADYRGGGDTVPAELKSGETSKNLYIGGNNVNVSGKVTKDLVAGGGNVTVTGSVADDLIAGGGNLSLRGVVGGSARIAGGTVVVESTVGDDLLIGGGDIKIPASAKVGSDLIVAGGTLEVGGKVDGNAYLSAGTIVISGQIDGDVQIKTVDSLTVKSGAIINGKLTYSSANQANIETGASIVGGTDYKKVNKQSNFGQYIGWHLTIWNMLSGILALLLLVLLFPKLGKYLVNDFFKMDNVGWGLVFLIITPILAILIGLSLVLWKIGLIVGLAYAVSLIFGGILVPLVLGSLLMKYVQRQDEYKATWLEAVVGGILATLVSMIPVVGGIIIFLGFVLVLGSLVRVVYKSVRV